MRLYMLLVDAKKMLAKHAQAPSLGGIGYRRMRLRVKPYSFYSVSVTIPLLSRCRLVPVLSNAVILASLGSL